MNLWAHCDCEYIISYRIVVHVRLREDGRRWSWLLRCAAVDTNAAGNGNLEVTVTNPAGSTMYNYVRPIGPTIFGVYFTPTQSGTHLVNASFNGEVVCGSYHRFPSLDRTADTASITRCRLYLRRAGLRPNWAWCCGANRAVGLLSWQSIAVVWKHALSNSKGKLLSFQKILVCSHTGLFQEWA